MGTLIASYVASSGSEGTSYYRETASLGTAHHAGSYYLGCEGNRYRIIGYKFTAPGSGITQLSFTLAASSYETGYSSHTSALAGGKLGFCITSSNTPPLPSQTSLGTITTTNSSFSSSTVKAVLTPNAEYYLWIYSTEYYQGYWEVSGKNMTITYQGGVVNIYTSSGWKKAIPWVYTSGGWKQAVPWIYTSSGWKNTC